MKEKKKKETNITALLFLVTIILLYLLLYIFEPGGIKKSLEVSVGLLIKIIPVFLLVIVFIGLINYFVNSKMVAKYVGKASGMKGWIIAVFTGILSHGPVYAWYPLFKELKQQGMSSSLIAVFLYNRSIKIPLLPVIIYYFGPVFVVILLFYMIIASLICGKVIGITEK